MDYGQRPYDPSEDEIKFDEEWLFFLEYYTVRARLAWHVPKPSETPNVPAVPVELGEMVTAKELAKALGVQASTVSTWLTRLVFENPFVRVDIARSEVRKVRGHFYWTKAVWHIACEHFLKSPCKVRAS
ncbi:MAG: hypothetical protein FJ304_15075 [Planctomycetes bacterium]|nr:hypothetical protein [Planctomycetota bacterium]